MESGGCSSGPPTFEAEFGYFDEAKQWMVNFRVADMDAMVAQLAEEGIEVEVASETYPNARFAHLRDPEGNKIERWEPAGDDLEV